MELQVWCQTDIGLHRKTNQDRFLIDHKYHLYTLADGMGGHSGGDIAASIAVQTVRDVTVSSYNQSKGVDPKDLMTKIFNTASKKVYDQSKEQPNLNGMGTTLVVALYRDDMLYIGHVGDSRTYLFSKSSCQTVGMWQITEDHSLVNERIRAGLLKKKDIPHFVHKNVLTRNIGFQDHVDCDIISKRLGKEDSILICSDGLTNMISDIEIYKTYLSEPPGALVSTLIDKAKEAGGLDNITILFIKAVA